MIFYFAAMGRGGLSRVLPLDTIRLLFTYIGMSSALARVQAEQQTPGLRLRNSATSLRARR